MTDKDIIKALEGCNAEYNECHECPFGYKVNCERHIIKNAFELVKRQQAEIERLNNLCEYWEAEAKEARAELPNNSRESIEIFVDRLSNYKEYRYNENCDFVPYVKLSDIEKVVYEMVGAENET